MPIKPEYRPYYRAPDWPEQRERIRRRAFDACEHCGAINGTVETHGELPVVVQCGGAHLDHDPANRADRNVAWLCRGCHLRHDHAQHRTSRQVRKDRARPLLAPLVVEIDAVTAECIAMCARQHRELDALEGKR